MFQTTNQLKIGCLARSCALGDKWMEKNVKRPISPLWLSAIIYLYEGFHKMGYP